MKEFLPSSPGDVHCCSKQAASALKGESNKKSSFYDAHEKGSLNPFNLMYGSFKIIDDNTSSRLKQQTNHLKDRICDYY